MRPTNRPAECQICEKTFRPPGTTRKDHPGTVRHVSRGLCDACYAADRQGDPDRRRPASKRLEPGAGEDRPFTDEELSRMPAHVAAYTRSRRPYREAMEVLS